MRRDFAEITRLLSRDCLTGYPKGHGHQDLKQIFGVRYSPDESHVAVGYADGACRLFSRDSRQVVATYPGDFDIPDQEEQKLIDRGITVYFAM